jgi:hypothetical protein
LRPGSAGAEKGWQNAILVCIHNEIGNELKKIGKYREYQDMFLQFRLTEFYHRYHSASMLDEDKDAYVQLVQSALTSEDRDFLQNPPAQFPTEVREFYGKMA